MNKKQAQNIVTLAFSNPELVNWRKLKRAENVLIEKPALYEAHCRGCHSSYLSGNRKRRNPYPPGRRHNEWQKSFIRENE